MGDMGRERLRKLKVGPYPTNEVFRKIAAKTSHGVGSPGAFLVAVAVVAVWGVTGPLFHFSDTWQLFINTGTTIVTFLMVFLIQNTQNRDSYALHLKLDELIRANALARNSLMGAEELTDEELRELHTEFDRLARERLARRRRTGAGVAGLEPEDEPTPARRRR
jgi:low affinity Fe/Cu permease